MSSFISIAVSLLVLAYLLYRQRKIRPVRNRVSFTLPLILAILGLSNFQYYFSSKPLSMTTTISIIFSLLFLAVGMGAIRALSVSLWMRDGVVFRQGTWLTITLWIVTLALHLVVDHIGQSGESTLLIYYAITLFVQRVIVQSRAKNKFQNIEPQY